MGIFKLWLFFVCTALCLQAVKSQDVKQFAFRSLTVNEGLSQNSVVSIAQDSIGYIWFATQDGLNKYDGRTFVYYDRQFTDITLDDYSHLGKVYNDNYGDLWIFSKNNSIERYNYRSSTFETFIDFEDVNLIYRPAPGKLWFCVLKKGLFEVDISSRIVKPLFVDELENLSVFDIISVGQEHILATSNGIFQIKKSGISPKFSTRNTSVSSLTILDDLLIAGTYGQGLLCYNYITGEKKKDWSELFPQNLNVQDLLLDSKSRLWIATYGHGVYLKRLGRSRIRHFQAQKDNPYALHYNDILKVYEDNTGVIWFGTDGAGLSYYDETLSKFKVITNNQIPAAVNVDVIRSIAVSDNTMWLGTSGKGLTSINRIDNQKAQTYTTSNSKLKSDRIMSLLFQNNRLWIGHQGTGLQYLEGSSYTNIPEFDEETIWSIASSDSKHIWVATRNSGIYEFNIKTNAIRNWNISNSGLKTNNIRTLAFNEDGTIIFIGSDDRGVYALHKKTQEIKQIEGLDEPVKSLLFHSNLLYVGTNGSGIQIYNTTSQQLKHITKKEGLPNAVIYGILMDENDHLWISTNRGISKIDQADSIPTITNYSNYDGLQAYEFNTGAYAKSQDGTLFFGGLEGLNWFKPSEIPQNTSKPKTVISTVDLFNIPIGHDKSVFNYDENTLTFTFSSLQFSQPERNLYQYQLVPHDPRWIESGNLNTAHYTNLAPNTYTFFVKSSNYDGIWNEHVASFSFQIKKPWYKTNVAFIIYSILLMLLLVGVYSYFKSKWKLETQVRLKQAESTRLQQLDDFRTQLYTNISHEFRTPLTLISGPIDQQLAKKNLRKDDRDTLQLVKHNAARLLGLVNQMMDLSLIEAGQIKLKIKKGNLGILLQQFVAAFKYTAQEKGISIESTITDLGDCWFDQDIVEKIGTNLLSNAIKYAPENSVVIFTAEQKNKQLQLTVINENHHVTAAKLRQLFQRFYQENEASEGIGVGLALVKDLVTLSKGTILANTLDNNRIQFKVKLPIIKNAFEPFELFTEVEENEPEAEIAKIEGKPTIIIIDDEPDILDFLASVFDGIYTVIRVKEAIKAIELIKMQLPELVISDIMMPDINGIELCSQLKKDLLTSHIPIILLTAKVTTGQKIEGLETGADAYITKPFSAELLKVRVRKLIETRAKLKQRFNQQSVIRQPITVNSFEEKFMHRLKDVLDTHLVEPEFTSDAFSKYMLMSRSQLHKKLKAIAGMSTSEFIRSQRLLLAKESLEKGNYNISEVAYLVGFNSLSYFIKCFKKAFNATPSQFVANLNH